MAVKFRRGPANDPPDFPWVLKKVRPDGFPVKLVVADKGCDAESNHEYAHEVLDALVLMPLRNQGVGIWVRGRYRRRLKRKSDERAYHQRAKVETVFLVEKRKRDRQCWLA